MNRRRLLFVLLLLVLTGCANRQTLSPLTDPQPDPIPGRCPTIYPQGRWQFVHAIEFTLADGATSTVLGVTTVDGHALSCALMTVEGFTLFQATAPANAAVAVQRAVPPFDRPGFADGLLADVRTLFMPPPKGSTSLGLDQSGAMVCRHQGADGRITDLTPLTEGCWQLDTYSAAGDLDRRITARDCSTSSQPIPADIHLQGYAPAHYGLDLHLISAQLLPQRTQP
jgi:hypothetical protein